MSRLEKKDTLLPTYNMFEKTVVVFRFGNGMEIRMETKNTEYGEYGFDY
jgi:hypothetical protein